MTPFDLAFAARDERALRAALAAHPSPPLLVNGWNVLQMACHMNWLDAVDALPVAVREACARPSFGREPLALASRHGWGFLVGLIDRGLMPLSTAAVLEGLPETQRTLFQVWCDRHTLTGLMPAEAAPIVAASGRHRQRM